jgi:glycosyltransferase involved in cell wall biosynthesis
MPFFSIIIPTYNRSNLVLPTIQSFLNQTYDNFELIIVDDGSVDDTLSVIRNIDDHRIRYFYITNSERGAARNFGASKALGEYFNFFDSDDLAYVNHLFNAKAFIQENNNPEIFHVGYRTVDLNNQIVSEETNFNYDINSRLIVTNFLGCNSVFVRKDIFKNNQFNDNRILASSEDWELWLRMASRYRILSSDSITFQINNHEGRSLFTIAPSKIYDRDICLINSLLEDVCFREYFHTKVPMFIADRYTFFALVFSLTKSNRFKTIGFLIKAFSVYKLVIFRRRFWASLKHLI